MTNSNIYTDKHQFLALLSSNADRDMRLNYYARPLLQAMPKNLRPAKIFTVNGRLVLVISNEAETKQLSVTDSEFGGWVACIQEGEEFGNSQRLQGHLGGAWRWESEEYKEFHQETPSDNHERIDAELWQRAYLGSKLGKLAHDFIVFCPQYHSLVNCEYLLTNIDTDYIAQIKSGDKLYLLDGSGSVFSRTIPTEYNTDIALKHLVKMIGIHKEWTITREWVAEQLFAIVLLGGSQ